MSKFIKISELSKLLNLVNKVTKKPSNHVLRYWESEFKQIRPKIINNRRYYSPNQVELFKLIKFLIKDKGLTISGAKIILNKDIKKLDDYNSISLKADYLKIILNNKSKKILDKIKNLKKYGKKNSLKS